MGQEVFGLLPGLSMYATLWLREHNRVCDILKQEHPTWSDEQLFQTARLILIGKDQRCCRALAQCSPVTHLPGCSQLEGGGQAAYRGWRSFSAVLVIPIGKICFGPSQS